MKYFPTTQLFAPFLLAFLSICGSTCWGSVAIINGASGTSEPMVTESITDNLNRTLQLAGATTQVFDGVPSDLSGLTQIWDIRFSNELAISASEEAQYVDFLQNGGGMFVMGENIRFPQRNDSVFSLISVAGGGSLEFADLLNGGDQTVLSPFDGPNAVSSINFGPAGGAVSAGTGQFISVASGIEGGTGIAFGVGDLANAPLGALTTIFDVNFMAGNANFERNLLRNLVNFVADEVSVVAPIQDPDAMQDPDVMQNPDAMQNPGGMQNPAPMPNPVSPGGAAVPEPTSMLIWASLACMCLGYRRRCFV